MTKYHRVKISKSQKAREALAKMSERLSDERKRQIVATNRTRKCIGLPPLRAGVKS
jgi:hypothetical protein